MLVWHELYPTSHLPGPLLLPLLDLFIHSLTLQGCMYACIYIYVYFIYVLSMYVYLCLYARDGVEGGQKITFKS